ncbi:hypothetical protein T05_14082 [Trichinella murrelli]|uniref:Uncharacterized protein n=1 Tax=Trichinella murrelli TaxID=144512 RepID=A0A0V0T546_9BILA|nr:hypothetical protein T05_14082 [Trichinella murrelli]
MHNQCAPDPLGIPTTALLDQRLEAFHLLVTLFEECHKKRAKKLPKSLVVKPLVGSILIPRAQFCILSPLKSKRAEEVASKLLEMFLMLLLLKLKTVHNEKLGRTNGGGRRLVKVSEGIQIAQSPSAGSDAVEGGDYPGRLDDQGIALRSGPEMVPAATSIHELAARLPRCDLPKFSGDFTEFRAFWDQFDYRVHQQKDLSNAAKLTYLCGCLTGKAADVISSLSSSNADYEVAMNRLREEFDRPTKVIRHQIKKLVHAPPKDVGLRSHYDHLRRTIDALTALGKYPRKGGLREDELSAAEMMIAISRDSLPTPVQIKWDEKTKVNETMVVDLSEYLQFLGEQAQLLEESRSERSEPAKPTKPDAKRRSSPLRRRHDGATFLHTAVADQFAVCEESPRAAETSELGRPTRQAKTRTAQWHRLILLFESFSLLFFILAMADISELGLVTNCCGGMSFVYESRAYKFKFTGQEGLKRCSIHQRGYNSCAQADLSHGSITDGSAAAEETKPIPVIYDEEASSAAIVTSGYFPDLQIPDAFRTTKAGKNLLLWQSALRYIVVFATGNNIGLLGQTKTWGMDDIVTYGFIFQALINKAAVLEVDLNPDTIIFDFEATLIPVIQNYFVNTRVQGCYFRFRQAVLRKVSELGLKKLSKR